MFIAGAQTIRGGRGTVKRNQDVVVAEPIDLPTERVDPLDPPPALRALRERDPICPLRFSDGQAGWLITGYALGRSMLVDNRFAVAPSVMPLGDPEVIAETDRIERAMPEDAGVLIALNPPQHTRIRRAAAGYFTVRSVAEREDAIARIVAERLDAMEAAGSPVDLVSTFALPLSSFAICEVLGVPHGDRELFERPSAVLADPRADADDKRAALEDFFSYCRQVVTKKRTAPGDDLLSDLIQKGELTEDEIVGLARQLFEAGHETTATQLSLSVFTLLRERSDWEALREDPALIEPAVEELLRFLSILQMGTFARTATEDVELEDVTVRKGEMVVVSIPAANRDPEKFADPDRLDLGRNAAGHVSFGHGKHMCIGQHLARAELRVALRGLLERFPDLDLAAPAGEISFVSEDSQLYGVQTLPVAW
ncbi:MAG: cytochrome P450 [Actinobacteria bacterium]|nr:cytochrome P450 [Actinomycetota bacterium]